MIQAVCQGGSFAVESVAAFAWNGWQASSGISGNLGLEYALSEHIFPPSVRNRLRTARFKRGAFHFLIKMAYVVVN
ncbi:hypothetical protein ADINL_0352 [Nitrincola lacisaponensis]|uniref:Uncharacterized protein n=1 Tax=Nitrincola lacisaponensis TaxID=267850 RepID=A0A063Y9W4_9GAMM|nr:hypothetical protein ADINL_0352 [Nitrincola lacisaponensis]